MDDIPDPKVREAITYVEANTPFTWETLKEAFNPERLQEQSWRTEKTPAEALRSERGEVIVDLIRQVEEAGNMETARRLASVVEATAKLPPAILAALDQTRVGKEVYIKEIVERSQREEGIDLD